MGTTKKWSYSGSFEYDLYEVEFSASGTHYYDPGCMYLRNGDPGYPPEEEFEVEDVVIEAVYDISEEAVAEGKDTNNIYDSIDAEIKEAIAEEITEALYDGQYEVDYDEPYYPEPDEY